MRLTTVLSALCCLGALSACAGSTPPAVEIRTVRLDPPPQLLTCRDRPDVPGEPLTEAKVMVYIAGLRAAHQDCQGKLAELRRLYSEDMP